MAIQDNLMAAWDFRSGSGGTIADAVDGVVLTLAGATFSGGGLLCDANNERAFITAPAGLRITGPMSIGVVFDIIGTPTDDAGIFGLNYSEPESAPVAGATLSINSGVFRINTNNGTDFRNAIGGTASTADDYNLLGCFRASSIELYSAGLSIADASPGTLTPRIYDSTAAIFAGCAQESVGRNPNVRIKTAYLWDADKTADVAAFAADPEGDTWAPWSVPPEPPTPRLVVEFFRPS
jgi:hypothetical protein